MGLYERLLEERGRGAAQGEAPGASYGSDSPVLDRILPNTLKDRRGTPPTRRRCAGSARRSAQSEGKPEVKVQLNRSGSLASRSSRVW